MELLVISDDQSKARQIKMSLKQQKPFSSFHIETKQISLPENQSYPKCFILDWLQTTTRSIFLEKQVNVLFEISSFFIPAYSNSPEEVFLEKKLPHNLYENIYSFIEKTDSDLLKQAYLESFICFCSKKTEKIVSSKIEGSLSLPKEKDPRPITSFFIKNDYDKPLSLLPEHLLYKISHTSKALEKLFPALEKSLQ